jgi:uncharacterized C2H2 Zn-finger protein
LLAISARKSLKAKQIEVSQAQQSFKDIKQCSKCGRFWKDRKDYGFHTPIAHKDQWHTTSKHVNGALGAKLLKVGLINRTW